MDPTYHLSTVKSWRLHRPLDKQSTGSTASIVSANKQCCAERLNKSPSQADHREEGKKKLPRQKKQHKIQQQLQFEEPASNHSQFIAAPHKYPVNSSQGPVFGFLKKNLFLSGKRKGIWGKARGELKGRKALLCQLVDYQIPSCAVPNLKSLVL